MPNASDTETVRAPGAQTAAAGSARAGRGGFLLPPWARWVGLALGAALVLLFPELSPNAYVLSAGVIVASYACTATAWSFMGGFTGYVSLGHAAFFGLGAYGTGILIRDLDLQPFLAWLLSGLIVLVITVPIGIAALRVRGASFVIVSISFVLILLLVFQAWEGFTGGANGLNVPRPFADLYRPDHHRIFYYLFVALLAAMLVSWWAIDRSRFGAGLKAIREDEDKAEALGVPTRDYKLAAYLVSATFTALAGGMYALWFGDLDPIFQFSILLGAYMVLMALLGGARHLFGPLVGAVVVGSALEYFKLEFGDTQLHLVATALLLGVVVLFMPDGVIPAATALLRRLGPQASSIREITAEELLARNRAAAGGSADPADPADPLPTEGAGDSDPAGPGNQRKEG